MATTSGELESLNTSSTAFAHETSTAVIIGIAWPPWAIVLGTLGNVATIFVMRRSKDHYSAQYVFIIVLAVVDIVALYTGMLHWWIFEVSGVDVRVVHIVSCRVHMWLTYSSNTSSAWLVTCITVQRTMAVLWPHRMRVMCTVRKTWIVAGVLVLSVCVFQFHFLLGWRISPDNRCVVVPGFYEYFFRAIYNWLGLCVSSLVPYVCLLVCDIILSMTLFRASSLSSLTSTSTSSDSTLRGNETRRKTASNTTVMVLVLSCTFVVLTLPLHAVQVWFHYTHATTNQYPAVTATTDFLLLVTFMMLYTNNAVNFLLYCLSGTKFRREFWNWIHCKAVTRASAGKGAV